MFFLQEQQVFKLIVNNVLSLHENKNTFQVLIYYLYLFKI